MYKYLYYFVLVYSLTFLSFSGQAQQLKLGNNPTQIEKSAVLELESNNQGLLLTRVPDTGAINALNPPDGMIIYFTDFKVTVPYGPNAGIYQRKDGKWQRIAQFFTVSGSPGPHEDIEFTRSYDTVTLHLPDATPSVRGVVNDGSQTFGGDKYFNDNLSINGTAQIGATGTPLYSVIRDTVRMYELEIPGGGFLDVVFDVPNASVGATVMISPGGPLPANCSIGYARVSNPGQIEVRFMNNNETTYTEGSTVTISIPLLGNVKVLTSIKDIPAANISLASMDYYFTIIK